MRTLLCMILPAALFLLSGCAWFRDERPEPNGPPYAAGPKSTKSACTEAEAVNAAVSAISLRMAASSQGPFRVVPLKGKTTPAGFQVIDSLARMRLSRIDAAHVLHQEDARNDSGEWTLVLRHPSGSVFFTKTFYLKGESHAGP